VDVAGLHQFGDSGVYLFGREYNAVCASEVGGDVLAAKQAAGNQGKAQVGSFSVSFCEMQNIAIRI
jgi:hypothetical protein